MQFETLRYEKRDGIAWLTLNRPERLNAINGVMSRELPKAWDNAKADPEVVAVVVTGAGDRALCTGYDVSDVAAGNADVGDQLRLTAIQNSCWKPVITAVNGMVCGGGLHFVADSDIVICSDDATFFDSHVNVGLVSALEPIGLARRAALEPTLRLALVGRKERMPAQRAFQLGWVGEVVPKAKLLERAAELAQALRGNSTAAMAQTKRAIWQSLNLGLDRAQEMGWSVIEEHWDNPDIQEGAGAFREKRPPRWAPLSL
jgi:enoyl-CoA hydratase/carnithine racemase